jgi:GT2 family glycosyltransferase
MELVDLSIAIVNWNTCDLLAGCLSAVQQDLEHSKQLRVETFVVDNASSDNSPQMVLQRFPWVNLISNQENLGFARANNQAIQQARGKYVLLLNSDTEIHIGALESLVSFTNAHPRVGACGARLIGGDGRLERACHPMLTPEREFWRLTFLDQVWPRATYTMENWDTDTPRRVEVIKGACLLLRSEALDQVGLLDGQYHMYTEEVDICYRLDKAGWELWYVPQAVVTHYGAASSMQAAETMYVQLYRSKVQFYRKIGGERSARRFKILTTAAYLPRALLHPKRRVYRRLLAELPGM